MNFSTLQDDIRAYLERGNVTDTTVYNQLPRLINLAEENISREMKIQGVITTATGNLVAGTSVYAKPARWRATISMFYGTGTTRKPIWPRSYEYCRMYAPDSSAQAPPELYADFQYVNWLIAPTPDAAYNWEISYYAMPALLDSVNTTNWLTDYAPQVILYASLLEAGIFLKNDEMTGTYQGKYQAALAALTGEDMRKIVDRTSTRQAA